jgi:phosphoglycolate phosphatase
MPRHLIFDLDGTLVDSVGITVAIINQMLAARGRAPNASPAVARAHVSAGGEGMIKAVMGGACDDPVAAIAEFRRIHAETPTPPGSLFPGVATGLQQLADAGFTLSICSNKPQNLCEKVLADLGVADHFALVVGSRPGFARKPAPDLLQLVMDQLGAVPGDCLFVGDSELDLQAAEHFAMCFVLVEWGYVEDPQTLNAVPGGHRLVATMPALVDLVMALRLDGVAS